MLTFDIIIMVLQMVLTIIAYESSVATDMPATLDPLLPIPSQSPLSTPFLPKFNEDKPLEPPDEAPYIVDLRLSPIIDRLRRPAPPVPVRESTDSHLLPLPNTTPWQLPNSLQLFMQARSRMRERVRNRAAQTRPDSPSNTDTARARIPGGLDTEDGS